jgi:hypothetical protein
LPGRRLLRDPAKDLQDFTDATRLTILLAEQSFITLNAEGTKE